MATIRTTITKFQVPSSCDIIDDDASLIVVFPTYTSVGYFLHELIPQVTRVAAEARRKLGVNCIRYQVICVIQVKTYGYHKVIITTGKRDKSY